MGYNKLVSIDYDSYFGPYEKIVMFFLVFLLMNDQLLIMLFFGVFLLFIYKHIILKLLMFFTLIDTQVYIYMIDGNVKIKINFKYYIYSFVLIYINDLNGE